MTLPELAAFKYPHNGPFQLGTTRKMLLGIGIGLTLIVSVLEFPFGLLCGLIPLIIYWSTPKKLYLGPRYLICGRSILYYGNIVKIVVDYSEGLLTIQPLQGNRLLIERSKFPTNARKPPKIAANKAAKFGKVSATLIEKICAAVPSVELQVIKK